MRRVARSVSRSPPGRAWTRSSLGGSRQGSPPIALHTTPGIPGTQGARSRSGYGGRGVRRPRREAARVRAPELLRDHPRLQAQHLILLRPRPNANDRAWRSGAREPFSPPPVLDRRFGSICEQRTTNASRARVASVEHSLTVGPNGPTVLQDAYVVPTMQHFDRERVLVRVVAQRPGPRGALRGHRGRHAVDERGVPAEGR